MVFFLIVAKIAWVQISAGYRHLDNFRILDDTCTFFSTVIEREFPKSTCFIPFLSICFGSVKIPLNPEQSQDPEDRPDAELLLDILGTCSSGSSVPPMLPLFLVRSSRDGWRMMDNKDFYDILCKGMNSE